MHGKKIYLEVPVLTQDLLNIVGLAILVSWSRKSKR